MVREWFLVHLTHMSQLETEAEKEESRAVVLMVCIQISSSIIIVFFYIDNIAQTRIRATYLFVDISSLRCIIPLEMIERVFGCIDFRQVL